MIAFRLLARDGRTAARLGELVTPHGVVRTPAFMPCATQATVKTLTPEHLEQAGVQMLLCNSFHLALRPGAEEVARLGGLHRFMSWPRPILTDSGGFQIFSLSAKGRRPLAGRPPEPGQALRRSARKSSMARLCTVSESGVLFRSHLDGREVFLTPERCMEIQEQLGADIAMTLDECLPFPTERALARAAVERTVGWAARCRSAHRGEGQALFGIVQGCTYPDLRAECADRLVAMDFPGYGIGGLSVGEGPDLMQEMIACTVERLPQDRPRYLLGVGRPEDILAAVAQGVDLFDCVIPTRCARNGLAFTSRGRVKLRNVAFRRDDRPLDESCDCATCRRFSRAYLRHLLVAGEVLGLTLMSLHNVRHYMRLMEDVRRAIAAGSLDRLRQERSRVPWEEEP